MKILYEKGTYEKKWQVLICVITLTFMCCLDSSIVNVALPVIAKDLNVSMSAVQWIVTSYLIIISCLILLGGRLGDIKGKSYIFKIGACIFTFGSLLCGISKTLEMLIASRVIQGLGASCTMATSLGIITDTFKTGERGKAIGLSGAAVALGTMVGPGIGGFIVSLKWEFIFLINIPIGIISLIASMKVLPKRNENTKEKIDIIGTILFTICIITLVLSVTNGEFEGYTSKKILLGFLISIITFILFLYTEHKVSSPILDLSIFKNKLFSLSIFCGFISFISISCLTILLPFYLQDSLGFTPFKAGMFLMIYPLVLIVVAPFSGSLSDKVGAEIIAFIGLIILSVGFLFMGFIKETTPTYIIAFYTILIGLGNGMFQSPNNSIVMSKVSKNKLGIAGSINSLVRNLGMIFGVTLATTLLYNKMSLKLGYIVKGYVPGKNDVFLYGMDYVYKIALAFCLIGALLSGKRLLNKKKLKNI